MPEVINKRAELKTVTPMMRQYLDVKEQYDGYILMYRLGDFYECFYEDAVIASRELEITLTSRDCGDGKRAGLFLRSAGNGDCGEVESGARYNI